METLFVFREHQTSYQLIGSLTVEPEGASFAYDGAYLATSDAASISASLPLADHPFKNKSVSAFFAGLAPEGDMKRLVSASVHSDSYASHLARLNEESLGGLLFGTNPVLDDTHRGLEPLAADDLRRLRDEPKQAAFDLGMTSRLSLSGAQSKAGLYHVGDDPTAGWFRPFGTMPSTHIVKTPDAAFPHQTVNEALCLGTARECGFEVASWELIPVNGGEPLLAVRRFDRVLDDACATSNGLPIPRRLHQEDFCQASSLMPDMKYEPSEGHYLSRCAHVIASSSSNPFGDRALLLQSIFFDYLIGNCDNHLKNHAMLWDDTWRTRELAPRYDITCTTIYPQIYLEMGVSLSPSRRIDQVTSTDIDRAISEAGVPLTMGRNLYREVWEDFLPGLERAEMALIDLGYPESRLIAEHIRQKFQTKIRPFKT